MARFHRARAVLRALQTEISPMMTAQDLMLAYIAGTAEQSAELFGDTGTLELPYLASIGLSPVLTGRGQVTEFLSFLHGTLYPGFRFEQVKIHLHTPDQAFAEYHINHSSGISGKTVKQQFFGHLEAESGRIRRLREAIDVVVAADAIFPNGIAEVVTKRAMAG